MAISDPKIALEVSDRVIVLRRGQIVMQIDTKNKYKIKIELSIIHLILFL